MSLPARWHQDLIRALNSGDVMKADAKMRDHCRYGMEEVLRRLEATLSLDDARVKTFARTMTPLGGESMTEPVNVQEIGNGSSARADSRANAHVRRRVLALAVLLAAIIYLDRAGDDARSGNEQSADELRLQRLHAGLRNL